MPESYAAYRLPELWASVAGEDVEAGFVHVNTLNRLRVALEQQRNNLRVHRDRLIEGWPPERSEAAEAFVARINGLIDTMTATASAAGRVCAGADEAFAAIRELRRQLEPLMGELRRRQPGAGLVTASAGRPDLDRQARSAYAAADAKIARAAPSINAGLPHRSTQDHSSTILDGEDAPAQVRGGAGPAQGRRSSGTAQSALITAPVFDPPPPGSSLGPVLTEGTSPAGGVVIGTGPTQVQPASGPSTAFPFGRGITGPTGLIVPPRPAEPRPVQSGLAPMPGVVPRGSSAAARSGVIRRPPPPQPQEQPARGLGAGGYRDRSYEAYTERRRSRRPSTGDEVWPVEEGVPPVLEPPRERRHDPGPGVLGIDR
ncbi:hypothetical protein ACQP00_08910 [Dactylosporangium sp. CS-047395]|uniref:hypothetical protein n=1 Tax=Dactylosporangium sp. CS-047395 TaxID=3239936 RepID=UPI003D8BC7BF